MKWLFLLLLAANLAYYLLASEPPAAVPETESAHQPLVPSIILLSESIARAPRTPTAAAPAVPPDPASLASAPVNTPYHPSSDEIGAEPPLSDAETANETASAEPVAPPQAPAASIDSVPTEEIGAADRTAAAATTSSTSDAGALDDAPTAIDTAQRGPSPTPALPRPDQTEPAAPDTTEPEQTEAIATEKTADTQPQPPEPSHSRYGPIPQPACFRLGPFDDSADASANGKQAVQLGFKGRLLQTTSRRTVGFHIEVGPYNDPDEQQYAMQDLTRQGITGVQHGDREHSNILIAGDFSTEEQAQEALATLEKNGYKARLVKRKRSVRRFFLDLEARSSPGSPSPEERLRQHFPEVGLRGIPCRRSPK